MISDKQKKEMLYLMFKS